MLFKRGEIWWFRFRFQGHLIRESSRSHSKTVAREAERQRRSEMERQYNRIPRRRERVPLFSTAAEEWLAARTGLAPKSLRAYRDRLIPLNAAFGARLACDIGAADIAQYQRDRLAAGMSGRTINYDILALRGVLRHCGLWAGLADRVRNLRTRHDVGKAISREHEDAIIAACGASPSPAMLPLFVFSADTGLRASEMRALRWSDLKLKWRGSEIASGELVVPKSKTEAGVGRLVPLTARVRSVLAGWAARFPERLASDYVFPRHRVGLAGNQRRPIMFAVDGGSPMQEWKNAWASVCRAAGVRYRWHDCRHTFVSRLAESPAVSEQTIMALSGHVSRAMLARYSHIRTAAKLDAISVLERGAAPLPRRPNPAKEASVN